MRILEQHTIARRTMGECLLQGDYPEEALPFLEKEAAEEPKQWTHLNSLGICYRILGDYDSSIASFEKALALEPRAMQIHHNLGMAYEGLGRFDEAIDHYAVSCSNSANTDSQYALGCCLLRDRKFDLAASFWETGRVNKRSAIVLPGIEEWRGQELAGKRLLVIREGGYGDVFWLLRYLKPLKDAGATVAFYVFKSQISLLSGHPWIDRLMCEEDDIDAHDFDYQVPLWSVMLRIVDAIPMPMSEPYIKVRPVEIPVPRQAPKIGLCWKAGELLSRRKVRSIQDEYLGAFADIPVNWVSLVLGEMPDWCVAGINPSPCGWKATAEVIAGLDLVISADTSVFHLAACMGKPTWVFLPLLRDWKFFRSGETSEWYPSVRIFQNSHPASFQPVVDKMVSALNAWVGKEVTA